MVTKYAAEVITEHHPLFKGLVWVAAARSSDSTRYILNLVKIEKKEDLWYIVATDGRRMHVHTYDPGLFEDDIELPEPGLYEVVAKNTKLIVVSQADETAFPDWRQCFTRIKPPYERTLYGKSISKIGIDTGVLLATDFASDALGFGHGRKKTDGVAVAYGATFDGEMAPFYLKHDLGEAIVMPMRQLEDDEEGETDEREQTGQIDGVMPEKPEEDEEEG